MNQEHNSQQLNSDLEAALMSWLEVVEEIRWQMDGAADTAAELVLELLRNEDIAFGDQYVAVEMGIIAGRIQGIALARGITTAELLAQLPPVEAAGDDD